MKTKHRTFRNPQVLNVMLVLRSNGWPIRDLSFIFQCEHTSIRKQARKAGLPPRVLLLPRPVITFQRVVYDFDGERINQGHDYKDYLKLKEERKRQLAREKLGV